MWTKKFAIKGYAWWKEFYHEEGVFHHFASGARDPRGGPVVLMRRRIQQREGKRGGGRVA
jgi:hypothetical protein